MAELAHLGGELKLFAEARRWKAYFAGVLTPHLRGHVLEVGAGLGSTLRALAPAPQIAEWTALEPDPELHAQLLGVAREVETVRGIPVRVLAGTLADLPSLGHFDTIVYVDVLEHIEDDRVELARAFERLRPDGRVIVLAPAHALLFSEFDRQVGHHRRYDRGSLAALAPPGTRLLALRYLDSVGLLASLGNRFLLRAPLPSPAQIRLWDGVMIPASRLLDVLSLGRLGKSIIAVWERGAAAGLSSRG
jgi:SAM-dependent methyltransferase